MKRRFFVGILLSGIFFIAGSAGTGQRHVIHSQQPWKAPSWADTIRNIDYPLEPLTLPRGEELYYYFCLSCHGESGYGNGNAADSLKIRPTNFHDKNFTAQSDGAIYWKLTTGRDAMPSFKEKFGEEQLWQTIEYLRYLESYYKVKPENNKDLIK